MSNHLRPEGNSQPNGYVTQKPGGLDDIKSPINVMFQNSVAAMAEQTHKYASQWEAVSMVQDEIFVLSGNYGNQVAFEGYLSKMNMDDALLCFNEDNDSTADKRKIQATKIRYGAGSEMATDGTNIVVGLDRGAIVAYDSKLNEMVSLNPNSSIITGLHLSKSNGNIITTCGHDKMVVQVDLSTKSTKYRISPAHSAPITSMSPDPFNDGNTFVTSAKDKMVLIWDFRQSPGSKGSLFSSLDSMDCYPNAVHWSQDDGNLIYVGASNGDLITFDKRKLGMIDFITVMQNVTNKPIHRIKHLTEKRLAVISDHPTLNVVTEERLNPVYQGSSYHERRIRDVIQVGGKVYSIGVNCYHLVEHHLPPTC